MFETHINVYRFQVRQHPNLWSSAYSKFAVG
jgi:hypothetical protein